MRYGVYVNGEKVAVFFDKHLAENYMDWLADRPEDPTDSFDMVEEHD